MLIKRRQVEYWKSQFTDYNLKGVDNTSRSLFQSPTRIEIPVCFELALMSIFSLLSIVNTFGFVDPGNNWGMYWLSLLVDNPSIHFPTLNFISNCTVQRHISTYSLHAIRLCYHNPLSSGFQDLPWLSPSFLAQKFVFHSYSIQMEKSRDKRLIEDPRLRTQAAGDPYNSPYNDDSQVRPQNALSTYFPSL